MNSNEPPPRPAANAISFSADCFEVCGHREYWTTRNAAGWGSVARFETKAEAEASAAKRGRIVERGTEPMLRRIKWN